MNLNKQLSEKINNALSEMKCGVHGKSAIGMFTVSSNPKSVVSILDSVCCENFQEKIEAEIERVMMDFPSDIFS